MTDKKRVTASVSPGILDTLDSQADKRDLSRSATVTEIVNEWEQYRGEVAETRAEVEQLRGQVESERERREQVEQELAEKDEADDSGGASAYLRGAWAALGLSVAAAVAALFTFFVVASVLPSPSTWQIAGAVGLFFAQLLAAVGTGLGVSEIVVQVWRHGAALDEALADVVRGPFGGAD